MQPIVSINQSQDMQQFVNNFQNPDLTDSQKMNIFVDGFFRLYFRQESKINDSCSR